MKKAALLAIVGTMAVGLVCEPVLAAIACEDPQQGQVSGCCITEWIGNTSCTQDNPDLLYYGGTKTVDGQNLAACLESQCESYCESVGGLYADPQWGLRPLMRWDNSALACRCREVDPTQPDVDRYDPEHCIAPRHDRLVINEVDSFNLWVGGTDFVEIKNNDDRAINLGDYRIEMVSARQGYNPFPFRSVDLPARSLGPGEYFVACAKSENVANCDLEVFRDSDLSDLVPALDSGSGAGHAVALVRDFHIVDAVGYYATGGLDFALDPYNEGVSTPLNEYLAPDWTSLSRFPDGVDTDDNTTDFSFRCVTPGLANTIHDTDCSVSTTQRPTADAGLDISVECEEEGAAAVVLDGSGSTDPDSTEGTNDDIVFFDWFVYHGGWIHLGEGEMLDVGVPLGVFTIMLRVTDHAGATDFDETVVEVVDATPPRLCMSLNPKALWPADHRMVDIVATVLVTDGCTEPSFTLLSVESREPDDTHGAGDGQAPDVQGIEIGTPDLEFSVRAERAHPGQGRRYKVTYAATDASGNQVSVYDYILVPKHRGAVHGRRPAGSAWRCSSSAGSE